MQKIMEQPPPKHALATREVLSNLGFNIVIIALSERVFYHQPYGKKLAKLIQVTAPLLQTKVYLFWEKPSAQIWAFTYVIT